MIQVVEEYQNYLKTIPELIAKTDYKATFFIKLLGLKRPTYYRKLRDNTFTIHEVELLTKALFPKETYLREIKADLVKSRQDIKEGRVMEHNEAMKAIRRDYLKSQ